MNNFLSTINAPVLSNNNLEALERLARESKEAVSDRSSKEAAQDAFHKVIVNQALKYIWSVI